MTDKATALKMLDEEFGNFVKTTAKLDNAELDQRWLVSAITTPPKGRTPLQAGPNGSNRAT